MKPTTENERAEIDAMVADLEAHSVPEVLPFIRNMRETGAMLDEMEELAEWGDGRQREWGARFGEQIVRVLRIAAARGRLPRVGETASDLEREAQRVASGNLRSELTEAERQEAVEQLGTAAQLVRDRAALLADIVHAHEELEQRDQAFTAKGNRLAAELRDAARTAGIGTAVWRLNQDRRRETGRRRRK